MDVVRAPLRPPYDGPFLVMERSVKYFKILRNGKETVVSSNRLKPCFILARDTEDIPNIPEESSEDIPNSPPDATNRLQHFRVGLQMQNLSSPKSQNLQSPRHPDVAV